MQNISLLYSQEWNHLIMRKNLPHAILISGQKGVGQYEFASLFAQYLLCENEFKKDKACGHCQACLWCLKKQHPDLRELLPANLMEQTDLKKNPSAFILIEQVRQIADFLYLSTHRQGLRIVLIYPAESMNINSANAILKSLEEPIPNTLFLLATQQKEKLLPTIQSRCQELHLKTPAFETALNYLKENHFDLKKARDALSFFSGAPILAEQALKKGFFETEWLNELIKNLNQGLQINPFQAAKLLDKILKEKTIDLIQLADALQKWLFDLILLNFTGTNRFYQQQIHMQKNLKINLHRLILFYEHFLKQKKQLSQPLNAKLFLERFFFNYQTLFYNAPSMH